MLHDGTTLSGPINVLFTRAKKRVEVFSSLDPDKIQVSGTSTWGLRALKQYLNYARTGLLEQPNESGHQETNDFELSVSEVLRGAGYDVVSQVGVAGFFIDLAVRHPVNKGAFVMGIECDGATYHSARSARDRDRLRQEILQSLGWKIYRVWSTDWFAARKAETEKMLRYLQSLLERDEDFKAHTKQSASRNSLRNALIDLRDNIIKKRYPDVPLENGLLRKTMLEEFLRRKPTRKEDWFKFPFDLREKTDSKQVSEYLPTILELFDREE